MTLKEKVAEVMPDDVVSNSTLIDQAIPVMREGYRKGIENMNDNFYKSLREDALLFNAIGRKPLTKNSIKNVIFNPPATIVFWTDGSKTVIKAEGDIYDPEKGLAMAIVKKSFG